MKLRNKQTGHIIECSIICSDENMSPRLIESNEGRPITLAELNAEWEDAPEEPKKYWYIDPDGTIICEPDDEAPYDDLCKRIGNYFETKGEAEKAVEKLKAWKRLKDKGFRFIDHIDRDSGQGMTRYEWDGYVHGEDLDLLFGGEE